ncbi:MAG: serine/threonine protein kinase, partial [Clostridia bacterium]|nr:serine/threonine protein kinase [Clostridia bacterium]
PDWQATRLLGEGSFGKVYEIVRKNFGIEEHCALKVITIPSSEAEVLGLKSEGLSDRDTAEYYRGLVEEFVQEIALMSKLKGNANIVGYEDYAVLEHSDGIGWDIIIRMELLTALPQYMQSHAMATNDVIQLATDICSALEVCHEQKIIHRDIKPDNIFISSKGEFKLGDFGVAKTVEKTVSALSKKGTYTYMAPEVYRGEYYTTNVDLYSLGIVMYRLFNYNREPFLPPHPQSIKYSDKSNALVRRMNGDLIAPPACCDERLGRLILKAISFHSAERYQTASQLKADLQSYIKGTSVPASPPPPVVSSATTPVARPVAKPSTIPPAVQQFAKPVTAPPVTQPIVRSTNTPPVVQPVVRPANIPPVTPRVTPPAGSIDWVNSFTGQPQIKQQKIIKNNRVLRILGLIFGWLGVLIWLLIAKESTSVALIVLTLLVTGSMVFLTIPKLQRVHKIFAIFMLVCSFFSINIFSFTASILYLCVKKPKK